MSRRSWTIVSVVAVLLVGGAVFLHGRKAEPPKFETTRIDRGHIVAKITATGTLSALVTVQVGSQVSGRLSEVKVDFNSQVKKGELIAKIDPQLFQANLEQAKAQWDTAVATLNKSKLLGANDRRAFERSKQLRAQNLIAQQDLDTAQATADEDDAQVVANTASVEQAKANLDQARINLEYTNIFSPTDGTVISRAVDPGQTVAASLQAPTLFTIAQDLRKMQVHTNVAEADVGKLTEGMPASFRVDAYPADVFHGRISQIRNAATTVQNVVTYDAVIDVNNSDLRLRPGMTANSTMIFAEKQDALRVPNAALRFKPPPEMLRSLSGHGHGHHGDAPAGGTAEGVAMAAEGESPQSGEHHHGHRDGGWNGEHHGWGSSDGADGGTHEIERYAAEEAAADRKTLWVLREGKPVSVQIRVGITDGSFTEISEGDVQEGDEAITDLSSDSSAPRSGGGPGGGGGGGMRRMF